MINPRTNATAKTPKSATEKCEGSIFEQNKFLYIHKLNQNGGSSTGIVQRGLFIASRHATPTSWAGGGGWGGRGRGCHPHLIYTNKNNIA